MKPKLTKAEKDYLKAIIKPCRDDVTEIELIKRRSDETLAFIFIGMYRSDFQMYDGLSLPYFRYGENFRGMDPDRIYKPEDLGL